MSFKEFKRERTNKLLESVNEYSNLKFEYSVSDTIQDILKYYVKDKGIQDKVIHNILQDSCMSFITPHSDAEDILDAGYILGYVKAKTPGRIFCITFEKYEYYFVGVESDIIQHLRSEFAKEIKI
jgi:hypothetical protein